MRLHGIIFDFNGVLWWDGPLQVAAWRQFSKAVRGDPFSADEIRVHVHGRTNRHTLEYLTGRPVTGDELRRLIQEKEALYRQHCLDQGAAFALSPGAIDLLTYLVAHEIPHTIATASEKTNLDFFVEHLQLDVWFDLTQIVYDDGHRPGKPAPDIYLEAAARLALAPSRCLVVEDSEAGIAAAHAAGIGRVVALGPVEAHPRLRQCEGVDDVVESLREIPAARWFQGGSHG
jgi:beta-phosphoglucomutase-like phosphatase (HAD superfamily)